MYAKPATDRQQTFFFGLGDTLDRNHPFFRRRAAIEPVIGHAKADHRLGRNFLKGVVGDAVNGMLAAAAVNFKRMMNKWRREASLFVRIFLRLFSPHPVCRYAHAA